MVVLTITKFNSITKANCGMKQKNSSSVIDRDMEVCSSLKLHASHGCLVGINTKSHEEKI